MKRHAHLTAALTLAVTTLFFTFTSCSSDDDFGYAEKDAFYGDLSAIGDENGSGCSQDTVFHHGILTAGEWDDLAHWSYWSCLMNMSQFNTYNGYWKFYTNNRVPITVTDASGRALAGVKVQLRRAANDAVVWEAQTDNHGEADCWVGLFQEETAESASLRMAVEGTLMEGTPLVYGWGTDTLSSDTTQGKPTVVEQPIIRNTYVLASAPSVERSADIAFVVDATGSMSDEIGFLRSDLQDIIEKASDVHPEVALRTAALFYRDEDDEYLTRHSNFTDQVKKTAKFVSEQQADGGGDYPEAVHSALNCMLQDLSWNEKARTKIAFLILDAPAHDTDKIIGSLQQSVKLCAAQGIRIIPVAASGVDKNTEFMLRYFAMATGGTYVFLTDDSGVGNSHLIASVGPYQVELLNNLLIRLIGEYTE